MSSNKLIHVIPGVGQQELRLYPPAAEFYDLLKTQKEIRRLNKLRHLASLSLAFQGARQARFDYSLAMLYFIEQLTVPGLNGNFSLGRIRFSSTKAALQVLALTWNIGHIPGTFATEKGVYRDLLRRNSSDPLSLLDWPFDHVAEVQAVLKAAKAYIKVEDYTALSRALAIYKLLHWADDAGSLAYQIAIDVAGPFFFHLDSPKSQQWIKLRAAFKLIRHLAYLTLDGPYAGLQWGPDIPGLLSHNLQVDGANIFSVSGAVSEILSPVEKTIFDHIYHADQSRQHFTIFTTHTADFLQTKAPVQDYIKRWLKAGLTQELKFGRKPQIDSLKHIATVRLRSLFIPLPGTPADVEAQLSDRGFSIPIVFEYASWNIDALIEPNEFLIDFYSKTDPAASDIGKIVLWVVDSFEDLNANHDDTFAIIKKSELEPVYADLISQVINFWDLNLSVRLDPWRLQDYGLFPNANIGELRGGVWASQADLSSPIVTHVLRDRSAKISPEFRERYAELSGLRVLRQWLKKRNRGKDLRCRWLVATGSVQLWRDARPVIELDGAIVKISARSGKLTFYALEAKSGRENPVRSLQKRVKALGLPGEVHELSNTHAVLEVKL